MELEKVEAWLENNELDSRLAFGFASDLKHKMEAKEKGYAKISADDFERVQLVALLLSKNESLGSSRMTSINAEEWRKIGEVFSKLKFMLNDLKMNRIINYLEYAIGGNCWFEIVERQRYVDFLYDEVKAVIEKIRAAQSPQTPQSTTLQKIDTGRILNDLQGFKQFVERDGFLAFWTDSKVGKGLKNNLEEIAKGEFMGFLAGEGVYDKATAFREIPEGAGRTDVIRIEQEGTKRLFELKVISEEQNRFDTGLDQLDYYMGKENINESYYIVFEARPPEKRTSFENQYEKDGKKIFVVVIDLYQIGPTKKR